MKTRIISRLFLLGAILLFAACKQNNNPANGGTTSWVVVNNDSEIFLFGKPVALENLKSTLIDSLLKMPGIPEDIPIQFGEELLRGMRGEVGTQVDNALRLARTAGQQTKLETKTFRTEKGKDCNKAKDERTNCAQINCEYPMVMSGESAFRDSVNNWANHHLSTMLAGGSDAENAPKTMTLDDAAVAFFRTHEDFEGSVMYGAFEAQSDYEVLLNNNEYLSLGINSFTYQGGAHGNPSAAVATFDITSGRRLAWDDIVTDTAALLSLAEKKYREQMAEVFANGFEFDETFRFKLPDNFALTNTGVRLHYLHYEVGPYAHGNAVFEIPYTEISTISNISKFVSPKQNPTK